MTDLIDSVLGYFSDEDDSKRQGAKPAKRVKQYRKKRSGVSAKKPQAPSPAQPVKSIARLSPKSRAYLMRRLGASPKPRNTVARTKKNLRTLQKSIPRVQELSVGGSGDMDGFPEQALSSGYHFNNDAVDREVLEPNEELAFGMRRDPGYMTDYEDSDEGPEMKALAKQFSSVSTYSKFIRDGKQTEFGTYILNDSDKPYIESGKMKNGKIVIKRQQRPY